MPRTEKLKVTKKGDAGSLHVPNDVMKVLPENVKYTINLVEEGILYKPVKNEEDPLLANLPDWAKTKS